jgi:glycolate oxidase
MNILFDERLDGPLPMVDPEATLQRLREALPAMTLLHTEEDRRPFECDGLSAYRVMPMLVALPETLEQVTTLLRTCHEMRVPVVTRGAGTGLSGGALPLERGVLLVMSRFNRILELDPDARIARVQPGVRNLAISEAAAPHGLYYAPDPSSQIACSIGGNVAENAGGVHCLKYGLTVHNVLALEVITIEGEQMTLGSEALDAPGFDLLALFNGSEGMLGIITEVTVKLLPRPQSAKVIMASFDDLGKAGRAVGDIIAAGIVPGGLEMMDNLAIRAAEDFIHAGYPVEAEAILLCELDGVEADVADDCQRVREVLARARGRPRFKNAFWPATTPKGRASGPGARTHSRPWVACRRTITAWTAPFPGGNCRGYCRASPNCRKSPACGWPTSSTPAMATCIP